jgi:hypothetical protein
MKLEELEKAKEGIKKLLYESDDTRPCKTYKYLSQEDRKALQTALSCINAQIEFAGKLEGLKNIIKQEFRDTPDFDTRDLEWMTDRFYQAIKTHFESEV